MKLDYLPLEKVKLSRPVDRIAWILDQAKGKAVLDLGAYDETAVTKIWTKFWLHGRLAQVASRVVGIDHSEKLSSEGLQVSPNSVILKGRIEDLDRLTRGHEFDVIVAGEFIEHLPDALDFLTRIKRNPHFANKQLIVTTPNAFSLHNVLLGLLRRESTHPDHLQVYSFKTLNTLCTRAGFQSWEIVPYHVSFTETILRTKGPQKLFAQASEKAVHLFEILFPMLSGGWIVNIRI